MNRRKINNIALILPVFFLSFVGFSVFIIPVPNELFYYYAAISVFSFIAYGLDKNAAQNGSWRISESSLNLISLAGGWAGALFAQHFFRHKTRKKSFLLSYWITAILNGLFFIWLLTPQGLIFLGGIVGL
tara:strand:+ start:117617 stop:118006 length:390 start_codon:yes stop_codon:yes gene_type:complete